MTVRVIYTYDLDKYHITEYKDKTQKQADKITIDAFQKLHNGIFKNVFVEYAN